MWGGTFNYWTTVNPYSRSSKQWTWPLGAEFISKGSVFGGRQNCSLQPHNTFLGGLENKLLPSKLASISNFQRKDLCWRKYLIFQTFKKNVMWLHKTILSTSKNGTLWYEFRPQRSSSLLGRPWIRVYRSPVIESAPSHEGGSTFIYSTIFPL